MSRIFRRRLSVSQADNRKSKIQNRKWAGLVAFVVALVVAVAVVQAQQPLKVARIGFLDGSTASGSAGLLDTFRQEMRRLGWIEGKNITIEYRYAEQKPERLAELAADLVRRKVDLIVATGGTPLVAKKATSTIPIVTTASTDPVGGVWLSVWDGRRQCHRALGFSERAKHQNAGGTEGRGPQTLASWTSADADRRPMERDQACGCGTEAQTGGD